MKLLSVLEKKCFGNLTLSFFLLQSSLLFSALIYLGTFDEKYEDRMVPALIIGSVMFIPGVYYTFLFILILLKVPGYSYEIFERFE